MGEAFAALGIDGVPLVREEKFRALLRDLKKNDKRGNNFAPSRRFMVDPAPQYHRDPPKQEPKHRVLVILGDE